MLGNHAKACFSFCCRLLALVTVASMHAGSLTQAPGIWEGVYSAEQASRGQQIYMDACAECHREDLTGQDMSPSLVGIGFSFKWQGKNLRELYASMRYGMPQSAPGSLSDSAYADLTAFLLSRNGFPAGSGELIANEAMLATIEITSQP